MCLNTVFFVKKGIFELAKNKQTKNRELLLKEK